MRKWLLFMLAGYVWKKVSRRNAGASVRAAARTPVNRG